MQNQKPAERTKLYQHKRHLPGFPKISDKDEKLLFNKFNCPAEW